MKTKKALSNTRIPADQAAGELHTRQADVPALQAEDLEKVIPESLPFGGLPGFRFPFIPEGNGAVFNFIPGDGHARMVGRLLK